jgi:hypothetical protein
VRAEFQKILRRWIDPEKLGRRIAEGLDAMETRFFQSEGVVSDDSPEMFPGAAYPRPLPHRRQDE